MNAISLSTVFSTLLTRYRRQVEDLDAAADQDDIDRLTDQSQATLTQLATTRAPSNAVLADKIDALIRRYDDFDALPIGLVRELWRDAECLAIEPNVAQAWIRLWADLGCCLHIDARTGGRRCWQPDPLVLSDRYTAGLPSGLKLDSEAEAIGAAKALQALIKLGGKRTADAVFAFADVVGEA